MSKLLPHSMCVQSAIDPRKELHPFLGNFKGGFTVEVIFEEGEGIFRRNHGGRASTQYSVGSIVRIQEAECLGSHLALVAY